MSLKRKGSFHNDDDFVELGNSPDRFDSSSSDSCTQGQRNSSEGEDDIQP
jgi:hypothetical protein